MKKWFKYLAVPAMALALTFIFGLKAEPANAYKVNYGDCTGSAGEPFDDNGTCISGGPYTTTLNDVTNEEIEDVSAKKIGKDELGKNYSLSDIYSEMTVYKRKGNSIDGSKYLIINKQFISSEEELKEAIKNYINENGTVYTYSATTRKEKREEAIKNYIIKLYEEILLNNTSCIDDYFYSPYRKKCYYGDDIDVPEKYIISDFEVKAMDVWSKGNYLWTHYHTQRDTILFNLPIKDVEEYVESINSITITYSTCVNVTDNKCDETSEKKTVTYYDNGSITITRTKDRKKVDVISNMGLTEELAAVEKAHPTLLDSSNKYNRLFHSATASNIANTYEHYLVLNVDDTMYIEMIEVDCTLINGEKSVGNTEGSVVADNSTEVTTLALVTKCLMYLGYALLAIGVIIVAKSVLKPIGDVISDSSAIRKEKSIANAKSKKGNRKR